MSSEIASSKDGRENDAADPRVEEGTLPAADASTSDEPKADRGIAEQLARANIQVPKEIPPIGPPLLERGVGLARTIILVISVTICMLVLALSIVEYSQIKNSRKVEERVLVMIESRTPKALQKSLNVVGIALSRRLPATRESIAKAELAVASLQSVGVLTVEQSDTLAECLTMREASTTTMADFSKASGREQSPAAKQCALVLSTARAAADLARDDVEMTRALREIAKDVREAQQSTRSFWLQVAQLLLLNLLLPVLTALLGYIFGSYRSGDA